MGQIKYQMELSISQLVIRISLLCLFFIHSNIEARDYLIDGEDYLQFKKVQKLRSPKKTENMIRKEYRVFIKKWKKLKAYEKLYDPTVFSRDLVRVKEKTKIPKLLNKILTSLKTEEERIKYFIIPNFIDRELTRLYERTLLTGSKSDREKRKKLNLALEDNKDFFLFMNHPDANYRKITLKWENKKLPHQIDTSQTGRPKEEVLYGEFAKRWYEQVVPKIEKSPVKVVEHFLSPNKWKLIRLDEKKGKDYSFLVLELKKDSFEKWLNE